MIKSRNNDLAKRGNMKRGHHK